MGPNLIEANPSKGVAQAVTVPPFLREVEPESPDQAARTPDIRLQPGTRWVLTQVAMDFVTTLMAAVVSYWVYRSVVLGLEQLGLVVMELGRDSLPVWGYGKLDLTLAAATVIAMHALGAYRSQEGLLRIESVQRILRAVVFAFALTVAVSFLAHQPFSRALLGIAAVVTPLSLIGQRFVTWTLQDRTRREKTDVVRRPVLIYGAGNTGRVLAQTLLNEHPLGLDPVAFLDDEPELHDVKVRVGPGRDGRRLPVLGGSKALLNALNEYEDAVVFLAVPTASSERISDLWAMLRNRKVPCFFVPNSGDQLLSSLQFGRLGSVPVFRERQPQESRPYELAKRLMDASIAALILTLASPVLLASALAVRMSSSGPILFRQKRVGLDDREFTIYKLRTMYVDAPTYALHPSNSGDSRVTPVGGLLRRLSIDELPQLFNVLRGDMSLVGPRPEMRFVVDDYDEVQRQRLHVKPGLTGLWQISADRAFPIHDNIHYDLYYVENRSLMLDLAILLMTPLVLVAGHRGV